MEGEKLQAREEDSSNSYSVFPPIGSHWCGWRAAFESALSTYINRLSEYQLEASNELSRLAADPSRAPEAYATYMARLTQMYSEWQAAMQKLMADAQRLYENMQRNVEGQLFAPGNSGLGAVLAPGMKYGQAGSENPGGPGDWRFDPAQGLPLMDASVVGPAPVMPTPASVTLPATSIPAFPTRPAMPSMPSMPLLTAFTTPSPAGAAPPPDYTPDQDVLSARAELQHSVLPPAPPIPPSPQLGYTMPSTSGTETAGIKYRCDAYRRVARAKL